MKVSQQIDGNRFILICDVVQERVVSLGIIIFGIGFNQALGVLL